jgi:predicted MFS family arabinose efflux permease
MSTSPTLSTTLVRSPQALDLQTILLVLVPFACAHFVSYLYRTVNAVLYPDVAADLLLSADNLGLMTSVYFLAFALAQLPLGVALDKFGPRRVQVPMLCVAAVGALLFAKAHTLSLLVLARGLIGLGVAGSLMAAIKANSQWFPVERMPLLNAVLLSVGGVGAMASTAPVDWALNHMSWRGVFVGLACFTVFASVLIAVCVPDKPIKADVKVGTMLHAVSELFSRWAFWRLALYSLLAHGAYMAIQALWMGPWLREVHGFDRAHMAQALLYGAAAMVAGSLFFGWLTDALRRYGVQPLAVCGAGVFVFVFSLLLMVLQTHAVGMVAADGVAFPLGLIDTLAAWVYSAVSPTLLAMAFGFFGTAATMNYAVVAQSVPSHLTGRVSTCFNLLVFICAFVLQWGMGNIINLWPAEFGIHPAAAFYTAFLVVFILQLPGLALWFGLKPWKQVRYGSAAL